MDFRTCILSFYILVKPTKNNNQLRKTKEMRKTLLTLESPHRGDSNEYTQYTIFSMNTKHFLNYPKSAAMGFFQGTQE